MAAPPGTLEALVRDELRGPVSELVRRLVPELVAEAVNGAADRRVETPPTLHTRARVAAGAVGATREPSGTSADQTTDRRRCSICGEEKLLSAFQRQRNQCRECRRHYQREQSRRSRQERRARQAGASEPEEPAPE